MGMDWKAFLKPTVAKVAMTLLLFFVFSFLWDAVTITLDAWFFGFPFPIVGGSGFCGPNESVPLCGKFIYDFGGVAIDTLFWYVIGAGVLKVLKKR